MVIVEHFQSPPILFREVWPDMSSFWANMMKLVEQFERIREVWLASED